MAVKWFEKPKTFSYCSEYVYDDGTHYIIRSDGKTTTVKDVKTNITGTSKCHPEDEFNLGLGINLALQRMEEQRKKKIEEANKIEDGCLAEIIDNGGSYTTYSEFAKKYFTLDECIRYAYNYCPPNGTKVRVNRIVNDKAIIEYAPEGRYPREVVGLIRPDCLKRINQ